jgi:hypothetical protein
VLFCVLAAGCHVDSNVDDQPWPCDPTSTVDQCGTQNGRRMLCWEGFCTPSCDSGKPTANGLQCLTSGALVHSCHPSKDDCPAAQHCLRTDLLGDHGVCTLAQVCQDDHDCMDTARSTCAGSILRSLAVGAGALLHTDHLQCVQEGCATSASSCLPEESCLAKQYDVTGVLPDICVPKCDVNQQCPPNYACAQSSAEPGPDRLCLPGVPGVRCESDTDCLLGSCVDTQAGFSVCSLSCSSDAGCSFLNTSAAYYLCVSGAPGQDPHCLTARPFQGSNCDLAQHGADCPTGQECFSYDPYAQFAFQVHGECRTPCDADLHCADRGGLPHVCLDGGMGGCYPGNFGLPCVSSEECLRPLTCESANPSESICTVACASDSDCAAVPATTPGAYCAHGLCRLLALSGAPCDHNAACASGRCMNAPAGTCVD